MSGFWRLTGGRPMTRLGCLFIDRVVWREVNRYRDKLGREWMAFGAWSLFRVPYHPDAARSAAPDRPDK